MSSYVIASNGNIMAPIRYYDDDRIKLVQAGHVVYVDHTAATREFGERYFTNHNNIGTKVPIKHKAGVVHPKTTLIQPDCLEANIHRAVIDYIQTNHEYIRKFIVPGIGEFRGGRPVSIIESGYVKGQPDIHGNGKYTGLCIELKRFSNKPCKRGMLSSLQADLLNQYACIGYKTLVSCDFNEVTDTIDEYFDKLKLVDCDHCKSRFLNERLLEIHLKDSHNIE